MCDNFFYCLQERAALQCGLNSSYVEGSIAPFFCVQVRSCYLGNSSAIDNNTIIDRVARNAVQMAPPPKKLANMHFM